MDASIVEQNFRQRVCDQISLLPETSTRYRVVTPFQFDDGDHLVIVLLRIGDRWLLSDEGHTYMHLTYDLDEKDLHRGTRQSLITQALSTFGVSDRSGELVLDIPEGEYGGALYSFVQALLKITDVTYLSRERIYSTFLEDFRAFMEQTIPVERRVFDWHHPQLDRNANYQVDLRINQMPQPLFVYAVNNDSKARDSTISLLQFERLGLQFHSIAIFDNQEDINRQVLARLSDVFEKQFSSLDANTDRIIRYIMPMMDTG